MLCLLVTVPASAEIYRWTNPDGRVVYSDRPQSADAEAVQLPPLQTYTPQALPSSGSAGNASAGKQQDAGYKELAVTSPANDVVLRDNGGTVSVQVKIDPPLRRGHRIEIVLDGKPVGRGAGTSVSLANVDRGTHSVSAVVVDGDGKTLVQASAVTFHLKRHFKARP